MKQDRLKTPTHLRAFTYMRVGNPEQAKPLTERQQQKRCRQKVSSYTDQYTKTGKEGSR